MFQKKIRAKDCLLPHLATLDFGFACTKTQSFSLFAEMNNILTWTTLICVAMYQILRETLRETNLEVEYTALIATLSVRKLRYNPDIV